MLCNICKQNEATVHLTQVLEGKMKKVDLCEGCAKDKGVDDPSGYSIADVLLGMSPIKEISAVTSPPETVLSCPKCGFTQQQFEKSGRFGCPNCFHVFAERLETVLRSMHKGTQHVGKAPSQFRTNQALEEKISELQTELDEAVHAENFEQAAVLRDEIRRLKSEQLLESQKSS